MNVHYAVQVCDVASNQGGERYCNTDRTTLSIKCISSLMESIEYVICQNSKVIHHIKFFDDNSTPKLKKFLQRVKLYFKLFHPETVNIDIVELQEHGVMTSIKACYDYLMEEGTEIVYQVQDDYLYSKTAIYEMIDMQFQIANELGHECIVYPFNRSTNWRLGYRNRATPRTIFYGCSRIWIQLYDIGCCFMTTAQQLRNNKDLTDLFLSLPPRGVDGSLESISLNYMFTKKGILGVMPIDSLALHVQTIDEKDPYIDWESWWNSIKNYE